MRSLTAARGEKNNNITRVRACSGERVRRPTDLRRCFPSFSLSSVRFHGFASRQGKKILLPCSVVVALRSSRERKNERMDRDKEREKEQDSTDARE